jgi:ubiquinone/menaquinone biosynthesis C-methylase UbiE
MFMPRQGPTRKLHVLLPSKQRIAHSFGRKAATYDGHAMMQAELITVLVAKLARLGLTKGRFVDCGCGTGILAQECRKTGISGSITGVDIAFTPLVINKKRNSAFTSSVQADIDELPFKPAVFDGALIASTLQWLANPSYTLQQISVILKQGGFLGFSVFIQGSFSELFSTQSSFGITVPVHCPCPDDFIKMARGTGFDCIDSSIVQKVTYSADAVSLFKNISLMGGAVSSGKLLTRKTLADFCETYERNFHDRDRGVPLTYRAMVGVCRKGAGS